ncbi:MAG: hypothetical protein WCA07_16985 [Gloeobacterales cyanobacterium]
MEELKEIEFKQPVVPLHVYRELATETQYLRRQNHKLAITQEDLVEQNLAFMDEILRQEQEISQLSTDRNSNRKLLQRSEPSSLKDKKSPSQGQTMRVELFILVATVLFSGAAGYGTFYFVRNLVTPLVMR